MHCTHSPVSRHEHPRRRRADSFRLPVRQAQQSICALPLEKRVGLSCRTSLFYTTVQHASNERSVKKPRTTQRSLDAPREKVTVFLPRVCKKKSHDWFSILLLLLEWNFRSVKNLDGDAGHAVCARTTGVRRRYHVRQHDHVRYPRTNSGTSISKRSSVFTHQWQQHPMLWQQLLSRKQRGTHARIFDVKSKNVWMSQASRHRISLGCHSRRTV